LGGGVGSLGVGDQLLVVSQALDLFLEKTKENEWVLVVKQTVEIF
jgi:hypothetical protein